MTDVKLERYLLSKPASKKEFPFDEVTAVFKVMNKMFALYGHKEGLTNINLKDMTDESYKLVFSKLTRKEKELLKYKVKGIS